MINNSSFGFSPFKLNPKLEFYYLSIYSLRPTLLFSASNRSIGSLACSALGGGLFRVLGVVVGATEAGCMGAGAEPSGAVAGALLRAISWLTRQRQLSEMFSPVRFFRRKA